MARTILIGRAGSPGVGIGRLLIVAPPVAAGAAGAAEPGRAAAAGAGAPGATGRAAAAGAAEMAVSGSASGGNGRGPSTASLEHARLAEALDRCATELEALAVQITTRAGEEVGAIFEAQALFARDPGIVGPAYALIAGGATADEAIVRVTSEQADVLAAVDDDYFRERAADVRDVGRRVAAILRGGERPDLWHPDGTPAVLVAADLDPSAVATLRPELVAGIALAGGAPTGHAAIVARALGIPLVLGLGSSLTDVSDDAAGVDGAVDGSEGRLFIEPSAADVLELERLVSVAASSSVAAASSLAAAVSSREAGQAGSERPMTNGVSIVANVASALEAEAAVRAGADGIGLVRTELLFLGRSSPPSVGEQRATYARILEVMADRPVVFRTLDVGGDKPAEWQSASPEANPALGVRGVRLGLRRPDLLEDQFAALLQAAVGGELRVMLPMVTTREEIDLARERLEAVRGRLTAQGLAVAGSVKLGVMIEVPGAAVMADALSEAADFFSIGTNDLVQYVLAVDRTNAELADLASTLQPAVLRLIDGVVRAARVRGRHVAVCGEAAADPAVIPFLVGLGVTELSVGPGYVAAVRSVVAALDLASCRVLATGALTARSLAEVEALAR